MRPGSAIMAPVLSLSLELLIDGRVADQGKELLDLMRRHAPEALAGDGPVIRLDPGERASYLTVDAGVDVIPAERLVGFAEAACAALPILYGHVHLVAGEARPEDPYEEPYLFVRADELADRLPTLFWTTVLGPALLERLGRERVLSTPAVRVSEPSCGTVLLQLTERVETVVEDAAAFEAAREAAQRHPGDDRFHGSLAAGQHQGDARTAAEVLRALTDYGAQSLLEVGSIAPMGVAVPAVGASEWISCADFTADEAVQVITEMAREIAGERTVVLAALCDEDTARRTKVPEVRRIIRIRLEAVGEAPFVYFQPVVIDDAGARLEQGWTERVEPTLLTKR